MGVTVHPDFTLTVVPKDTTVQAGEEVMLEAQASLQGLTYTWSNGETGREIDIVPCASNIYTVTATDEFGCSKSESATINVTAGFTIDSLIVFEENDTTELYEGEDFRMRVVLSDTIPGSTYSWYVNDTLVSTTNGPVSEAIDAPELFNVPDSTFKAKVVITSSEGCDLSKEIDFKVLNNPVDIPNVFTPNGDQTNDAFLPVSQIPITIVEFKVWDRWGHIVYDNQNPDTGWDGKFKDSEDDCISDVYVYSIVWQITNGSGKMFKNKGDVTLLR
jgi:gliding motility-associated-like protein